MPTLLEHYPENFEHYERACRAGEVRLGKMFVVSTDSLLPPRYIINFPTKDHWKNRSRLESIESGLQDLVARVKELGIKSIAIPPLGCGNGGLDWGQVRPSIEAELAQLPDVEVLIFEP